MTALCMVGS